jgi:hypothetical protein
MLLNFKIMNKIDYCFSKKKKKKRFKMNSIKKKLVRIIHEL